MRSHTMYFRGNGNLMLDMQISSANLKYKNIYFENDCKFYAKAFKFLSKSLLLFLYKIYIWNDESNEIDFKLSLNILFQAIFRISK